MNRLMCLLTISTWVAIGVAAPDGARANDERSQIGTEVAAQEPRFQVESEGLLFEVPRYAQDHDAVLFAPDAEVAGRYTVHRGTDLRGILADQPDLGRHAGFEALMREVEVGLKAKPSHVADLRSASRTVIEAPGLTYEQLADGGARLYVRAEDREYAYFGTDLEGVVRAHPDLGDAEGLAILRERKRDVPRLAVSGGTEAGAAPIEATWMVGPDGAMLRTWSFVDGSWRKREWKASDSAALVSMLEKQEAGLARRLGLGTGEASASGAHGMGQGHGAGPSGTAAIEASPSSPGSSAMRPAIGGAAYPPSGLDDRYGADRPGAQGRGNPARVESEFGVDSDRTSAWLAVTDQDVVFEQARYDGDARLFVPADEGGWIVYRGKDLDGILAANPSLREAYDIQSLSSQLQAHSGVAPTLGEDLVSGMRVTIDAGPVRLEEVSRDAVRLYVDQGGQEHAYVGKDLDQILAWYPDLRTVSGLDTLRARRKLLPDADADLGAMVSAPTQASLRAYPDELVLETWTWRNGTWQRASYRGRDLRDLEADLERQDAQLARALDLQAAAAAPAQGATRGSQSDPDSAASPSDVHRGTGRVAPSGHDCPLHQRQP